MSVGPLGSRLVCSHRCELTRLLAPPGSRSSVRVPSLVTSLGDVCNARGVLAWRGPANPVVDFVPFVAWILSLFYSDPVVWSGSRTNGCVSVWSCPMADQENKPALLSILFDLHLVWGTDGG